jgi:hypothetical protein
MGTLLQITMKQKQFYIDKLHEGGEIHHWTLAELRKKYEQLRKEIENGKTSHRFSETNY